MGKRGDTDRIENSAPLTDPCIHTLTDLIIIPENNTGSLTPLF